MTNYERIKATFDRYDQTETLYYLRGVENVPGDLIEAIYDEFQVDGDLKEGYINDHFTQEDWDKIKKICDVYDSPLMRALR